MKLRRSILLVLLGVALMIGATPAHGEEFYAAQLRAGFDALSAGETTRAAEHCRIAAFGLMSQPPQLSAANVCIALASSAARREETLFAAVRRFFEIEGKFAAYAAAPLSDAYRRAFDALLVASVDRERLGAYKSLAHLLPADRGATARSNPSTARQVPAPESVRATPPAPPVETPQEEEVRIAEAPAPVEPPVPEPAAAEPGTEPPVGPPAEQPAPATTSPPAATATPTPEPATPDPVAAQTEEASAPDATDAAADRALIAARRLIERERPADAARIVYRQLAKTPSRRDLRLALLEAATLNKDWRTAAAQTDLLQPFVEGEEVSMFYAAVALFESDRRSDARRLLERARDRVPESDYVRYYTRRIIAMR